MENIKRRVAAHTLGCKVNMYDTEAMMRLFAERGYEIVEFEDIADIYIINTCTVTNLGDRKSRQAIRRAHRRNPKAVIAAVGCYAQVAPEEVAAIEGVRLILGTSARGQIVDEIEAISDDEKAVCNVADIMQERIFEPLSIERLKDRQRAFIKIQEGCDRYCTYCVIPLVRGPVRSRPEDNVISEVRLLAKNGYKEVVLTGIHVASYGKDLKTTNLLQLLERVHKVDGIERIRFSSIEPTVVTDEFVELCSRLPKICAHFHLSLQSGCERTLKRMNRHYTAEDYRMAVAKLRGLWGHDVAITTDVIAGFPGETMEDFQESYDFIKDIKLSRLHIFPYSPKRGTPAAIFEGQISPQEKEHRTNQLNELNNELIEDYLHLQIGKTMAVLIEREAEQGVYEGFSPNYITCNVKSERNIINEIVMVTIKEVRKSIALCQIAQ